jgi:hypothetical protein
MTENTGFAAYALWNALKLHFTSDSYDYFKYNGKTNVSKQTFTINKSKYQFYKLSRKYSLEELKDFYVANFLEGKGDWVGDLLQDGEGNYAKWQKRIQSLTYTFENDIIYLLEKVDNPNKLLAVESNQFPKLMQYVTQGDIALETLIILNDIMNFFPMWEKQIYDDIVWPEFKKKCERYQPFLRYDKDKLKKLLKEKIKEYAEA